MKVKIMFDEYDIRKLFSERYDTDMNNITVNVILENGVYVPEVIIDSDYFIKDRGI